jgi:hypothetical protein
MTAIQAVEQLLEDNWESEADAVDGRINDVPQPYILREKDTDRRRVNLQDGDYIFVIDGGKPVIEPRSLGWTEERIETIVALDIYTSHSRERLLGERQSDGTNEGNVGESYGGLAGETKRIMDVHRKGFQEWDMLIASTFDDLQSQTGAGIWRGQWELRMVQIASNINVGNDC